MAKETAIEPPGLKESLMDRWRRNVYYELFFKGSK